MSENFPGRKSNSPTQPASIANDKLKNSLRRQNLSHSTGGNPFSLSGSGAQIRPNERTESKTSGESTTSTDNSLKNRSVTNSFESKRNSTGAESVSSGIGTMPGGSSRLTSTSASVNSDRQSQQSKRYSESSRKGDEKDSADSYKGVKDVPSHLTDSQLMRRRNGSSSRADSPAVSNEMSKRGSDIPLSNKTTNGNSNGSGSNKIVTNSSLARSRKRARNENQRMGSKNQPNSSLLADDEDEDDESGEDEHSALNKQVFSDIDLPGDEMQNSTDLEMSYRGRQRRQTYQLPPRRRDSSLGGNYGHTNVYGPAGGTLPRRRRTDVSLTRATTIGGADPHGALNSAQRLAQSIRTGAIPPPPSEPPPATPLSGSLMSDLGSASANGTTGVLNPFALHLQNQHQQRQMAALAAAVAAAGGGVQPSLLSGMPNSLQNAYVLNFTLHSKPQICKLFFANALCGFAGIPNHDLPDLLQLQHQALLFQQQQQQHQQQQQQQQQLLASGMLQSLSTPLQTSQYAQRFGTLGRPGRTDPVSSLQPYLSAATLLSAQQQLQMQQHQQYQQHVNNANAAQLGILNSPTIPLMPDQNDTMANKSPSGAGGSGSVVYENSYNSFHRLLANSLAPSLSQDVLGSGIGLSDGVPMSPNVASSVRSNTLGRDGSVPPMALVQTLNAPNSAPPPPPNHPNYDLVGARTVEPTYAVNPALGTFDSVHKQQQQQQPVQHPDTTVVVTRQKSKRRCPWYYWIISILVLAFLLALVLAVSFSVEKSHLGSRLVERFAQDPAIIGLFDPNHPAVKLEPDRPVHVVLDRMGVWSAEWHMRTSRYVRYNITVSSPLSSIGIFMRHSTMPTIVHYDIFDRISGRNLAPAANKRANRVKRSSDTYQPTTDARETARVHYLEEGIWFLAFVNDQPRPEPFTFSIGDAIMERGCPNDCSNRGVCNRGNCDCVNGFKGPDCSVAELPKVCNGHGDYMAGACRCYPEWKGRECETLWSECPDPTCSGNGRCVTGECQCYPDFSGESCEIRTCPSVNCSGHGVCIEGNCRCFSGWSGRICDLPVPVMHTASFVGNTGLPVERSLDRVEAPVVRSAESPNSMALLDASAPKECPLDCGRRGVCEFDNTDNPSCHCLPGWTGVLCDRKLCDSRCFQHGQCANGTCICQPGWNGKHCTLAGCPNQCSGHGQCLPDAENVYSCHCTSEWKGSACQAKVETICDDQADGDADGLIDCLDPDCCPSSHCRQLAQLKDPSAEDAQQSCAHSDTFAYLLLITPMAQPGSSFYEQLEFLLRREQIVVENFDPRRISVIRGTIHQWDGTVFWGCRVSDRRKMHNGYTLTDQHGRFDLPVEGGSIVQLELLRYPTDRFSAVYSLYVPVNEIVNMGDFYMYDAKQQPPMSRWSTPVYPNVGGILAPSPIMHDLWVTGKYVLDNSNSKSCLAGGVHDPTALGGPRLILGNTEDASSVCLDTDRSLCVNNGILSYSIPLEDSRLHLIHRSDRTDGYQPVLLIQLLAAQRTPPERLREVHLVVDIAGLRYTVRLEPEPGLTHIFHWNRTDGYNRTVYGVVNAKVSVGYIYDGCPQVFWERKKARLEGHELTSSELANWNLDMVHHYSINHGIVYRGDGSHLFLKQTHWHVVPILGSQSGTKRTPGECEHCANGENAYGTAVFRIHCLFTDFVGNLVVGDGGFMRWLQPPEPSKSKVRRYSPMDTLENKAQSSQGGNDRRIWHSASNFKLDLLSVNFDEKQIDGYRLTPYPTYVFRKLGKANSGAYSSNPLSTEPGFFLSYGAGRTVWLLSDSQPPSVLLAISADCVEPTGSEPALPNGKCLKHPLKNPRGMAVSQSDLYVADDNLIWRMPLQPTPGRKRMMLLAVGVSGTKWSTPPCDRSVPASQMHLRSPDHLVYNAFEDSLYFADGNQVYRLHLASQMVSLAAGHLKGCPTNWDPSLDIAPLATEMELSAVRGLGVSPEGELYIAEPQRVWIRRADDRLYPMAGTLVKQKLEIFDLGKSSSHIADDQGVIDMGLAEDFVFSNITSFTTSIYGELFIGDAGNGVVYRIHYQLPRSADNSLTYRVSSPATDEVYVFNQHGQLTHTENAVTQMTLYGLEYRANAIHGWLSKIRGNSVNLRFDIHRDTQGHLLYFHTPTGLVYNVTVEPGPSQRITKLHDPVNGGFWEFHYSPNGLLLRLSRPQDSGFTRFEYAPDSGLLTRIIFPSGVEIDTNLLLSLAPSSGKGRILSKIDLPSYEMLNFSNPHSDVSSYLYRTTAPPRGDSNRGWLQLTYGEQNDQWAVRIGQAQHIQAGLNRPLRLVRNIHLPERSNENRLENTVLWSFDLNAGGGQRLDREFSATQPGTRVSRGLLVGFDPPSSWDAGSRLLKRFKRRSLFSNMNSALSLSGFKGVTSDTVDWQYQKTLVINGYDLLQVKFDWARQLETYQRASTNQVLLQVVYNPNSQPMIFNASTAGQQDHRYDFRVDNRRRTAGGTERTGYDSGSTAPAPLSLSYTTNGQLSAFYWGTTAYRFTYDSANRVKVADLGYQTESISYEYTDKRIPHQPTVIFASGTGNFKLFYSDSPLDDIGQQAEVLDTSEPTERLGLTRVLTPSGLRREFSRVMGLGVHCLLYNPWPGSPGPWLYEWGVDVGSEIKPSFASAERPFAEFLRFTWSSGYRRVATFPKQHQIMYDKTTIRWDTADLADEEQFNRVDSAPYVRLTDFTSGFQMTIWRTYRGSLLSSLRVQSHIPGARNAHPILGGLLSSRHLYTYNNNLNLIGIRTQLYANTEKEETLLELSMKDKLILDEQTLTKYDVMSGQLLSIREFDVVHRASALYITYAPKSLQLYRQLDEHGRLKHVVLYPLSSRRDPLYNLSLLYRPNMLNAVQQREEQRGQVPRWISFVHGPGGRLEAVDREEAGSSLRSHSVLVYNSEGRIARLRIAMSDPQMAPGGQPDSGSTTSRSEELQFIYDSRGLLKRRGNWLYHFDEDGFLTERRLHNDRIVDRFAYNSKGLLTWAERKVDSDLQSNPSESFTSFEQSPLEDDIGSKRAFRVQYVYDAEDRLVVVRDMLLVRDLMQYFYADPEHPNRVTHVFNHGRQVTFRLLYEPLKGHLFAVEEFSTVPEPPNGNSSANSDQFTEQDLSKLQSQDTGYYQHQEKADEGRTQRTSQKHVYFVITNHEGAPTAMFSEDMKATWTAEYSATGSRRLTMPNRNKFFSTSILEDANVPLGHASCLVDVHTGFLFCPPTHRAYDPLGATFTSPDWRELLSSRIPSVHRDPSVLDSHKWGLVEQRYLRLGPTGMLDQLLEAIKSPKWWLKHVGFSIDAVLPQFDICTGKFGPLGMSPHWRLPPLPEEFGLTGRPACMFRNCMAERLNGKIERLSVTRPSRLTPGGPEGTGLPSFLLDSSEQAAEARVLLLPARTMFESEIAFEVDAQGFVNVRIPEAHSLVRDDDPDGSVFRSPQLALTLLSGARLTDWWWQNRRQGGANSVTGMLIQSFARLEHDASSTLDELTQLGLKLPVYDIQTGHNLTLYTNDNESQIWLTCQQIQWRIHFVPSWDRAIQQSLAESRRRGEDGAWSHEIRMATQLNLADPSISSLSAAPTAGHQLIADSSAANHFYGLNYLWTFKQLHQLAHDGRIQGYRWIPTSMPVGNGTSLSRFYDIPNAYQLRPITTAKTPS
ncbi:unnamed protein product [Calicophoron daubneyi]|uniref:EGF-like domain-containing protein n=1 Tax=Calicophoron daubneyi TaxID=300641 RepID=A0AAV2TGR2_CALDB